MNLSALSKIRGVKCAERVYRLVWAEVSDEIADIGPSFRWGGRYNPKGEYGVLYCCFSIACCEKEKIKQAGGKKDYLPPQVLGVIGVELARCLDLTELQTLSTLGINRQQLIEPDFSIPIAIAREARRAGFEALIAPSAVGTECTNLIIFKDMLARGSYCALKEIRSHK